MRLIMSLNYLRCTKKQPDWMKLLSFPDVISRALLNAPFFIPKDADLLRNRKVNTKKRQNRHLPELAFLILGTYFTAPFLFYDAQLIKSAMYVTTPRPA